MNEETLEVPRPWLLLLTFLLWGMGALILCLRTARWLNASAEGVDWTAFFLIAVTAAMFYSTVFKRVVVGTVDRIHHLPSRVSILRAFNRRSLVVIGLMVTLGIGLRAFDVSPEILMYPYGVMGLSLLTGAFQILRAYVTNPFHGRSR